jgi:U3 small nucleolar RNA-associated protein 13
MSLIHGFHHFPAIQILLRIIISIREHHRCHRNSLLLQQITNRRRMSGAQDVVMMETVTTTDEVEMDVQQELHQEERNKTLAPATLSKSWSVASAHVPTYTGGKVTHCHSNGLHTPNGETVEFLLLPVAGDLALVDAHRGIKIRTLRQGVDGIVVDDEDEDDGIDADAITSYALSGNDEVLLTVSQNHLIRQYNLMGASSWNESKPAPIEKTWGRTGHALPVTHMEFHKSNVFVATGSVDGTVRIWDVRGGYVTHVFRPMQGVDSGGMHAISSISWKQDATQLVLAIGREDGSIVIHDLREDDNVIVLRDHVSAVTCMEWSLRDEQQDVFVSAGRDAVLNTWQIVKVAKKKKKSRKKKRQEDEGGARFTYQRVHTLPIYEQVEGMAILHSSRDSDLLVVTAGSKGVVRLWKATMVSTGISGFQLVTEQSASEAFGSDRGGYMGLSYNPHVYKEEDDSVPIARDQLIVPDAEHNLSFLHISDMEHPSVALDRTIVGHNDEILDLAVIPNGGDSAGAATRIAVATNSAQVRLFELGTFSCDVLDGHSATVLCVDVSPCGRFLATCGKDKTMRLWHLASQTCVAIATGHTEAVGAAALSRKSGRYEVGGKAATNGGGAFAVTASKDRTLKRWNLPGTAELDACASSKQSEIALRAFASVRAHEKVRHYTVVGIL